MGFLKSCDFQVHNVLQVFPHTSDLEKQSQAVKVKLNRCTALTMLCQKSSSSLNIWFHVTFQGYLYRQTSDLHILQIPANS